MATEKFANATCLLISWRNSEVENVKRSFGFSVPKQALPSCTTVFKTVVLLSEIYIFLKCCRHSLPNAMVDVYAKLLLIFRLHCRLRVTKIGSTP